MLFFDNDPGMIESANVPEGAKRAGPNSLSLMLPGLGCFLYEGELFRA